MSEREEPEAQDFSSSPQRAAGPPQDPPPDPKLQDRAQKLKDRLDEGFAEPWIPEQPGDTIVGVFKRLERAHTKGWGERHIVILGSTRNPENERAIWLLHTALRSQFRKSAPVAGELVAVRYEGKKNSGSGQEYEDYVVRVDRDSEQADWSEVSAEEAGTQPATTQAQPKPEPTPAPQAAADDDIPF